MLLISISQTGGEENIFKNRTTVVVTKKNLSSVRLFLPLNDIIKYTKYCNILPSDCESDGLWKSLAIEIVIHQKEKKAFENWN